MAIEKFKGKFTNQANDCTTLLNKTIQDLKDYCLTGLYAYLCTKPDTWEPNYKELMNHGNCSKTKIYKLLNKLIELNLITVETIRDKKGKFKFNHYTVLLSPNSPFPKKWEMDTKNPFPKKWEMDKTNSPFPKNEEMDKTRMNTESHPFPILREVDFAESHIEEVVINKTSSSFFNEMEKERILRIRSESKNLMEIKDEEFLKICETHVKTDTPKNLNYNKPQRIHGLCKLIASGDFAPPVTYSKTKKTQKEYVENIRLTEYQEYAGKIKSGIKLGLIPKTTAILNYDEWIRNSN